MAGMFAMFLASCSTDESVDNASSESRVKKVSLSAVISTQGNTRVSEAADGTTGLVTSWESGKDKINVLLSTGTIVPMTNVDGGDAFDGTVSNNSDVTAFSNTAYVVNDKDDDNISTAYNSNGYMEATVDYTGQKGSVDSIARYDLMYGTGIPTGTIQLNHKMCVLRLDINSSELSADAITKITGATLTYTPTEGNKQIFASSATYYLGLGASSLEKDTSLTVTKSIEMTGMNVSVSAGVASIYVAVPECSTATTGTLQFSLTGTDGTQTHCYYLTNNITISGKTFGAATVQGKAITALTENETAPAYGDFLYKDGSWGAIGATYNAGKTPVAIVFAKKDGMSTNDTEKGWAHGYAMALKNVNSSSVSWCSSTYESTQMLTTLTTYDNMTSNFDGFAETNAIKNSDTYKKSTAETDFSACYSALNYEKEVKTPQNTSGWYLPSSGQWYEILTNIGGMPSTPDGYTSTDNINMYWNTANKATCLSNLNSKMSMLANNIYDKFPIDVICLYWCSSEFNQTHAFYVHFDSERLWLAEYTKTRPQYTDYVRPVIAF